MSQESHLRYEVQCVSNGRYAKKRESIRVKPGAVLGVLREGPHAQQSLNMSDETAGVEPSRELGVSRDRHLRYREKRVNDERYA